MDCRGTEQVIKPAYLPEQKVQISWTAFNVVKKGKGGSGKAEKHKIRISLRVLSRLFKKLSILKNYKKKIFCQWTSFNFIQVYCNKMFF